MFKKILIANRGEIVSRIIQTTKKMGIKTVCIYSTADAHVSYLQQADEIVCIGDPNIRNSYLNEEKILKIADEYNCEAIHPGYGFFSENQRFATRCKQQKINFIGADSKFLRLMGDKIGARKSMYKLGIPIIPGSMSAILNINEALNIAKDIGYPVIIKATAGGGGKGIKRANDIEELKKAFNLVKYEAKFIFNNDEIYIEKFIDNAKHIEIQVAGDSYGNIIHLYERDCSVQRNNQKLLEESPATAVSPTLKEELYNKVIKALKKMKYNNIGTMEFLFYNNEFYFIEMNTRIQVEHPVSEMVLDIDIVEMQIKIAAEEKLSILQKDIKQCDHAIECRINAENAKKKFTPSIGKINKVIFPEENNHIRIDTFISNNTCITPYYDSMIAKIIVHEKTRERAINLMKTVLNKIYIHGIETTLDFQKEILRKENFNNASYTCNFLKENF